jgi:hypothetical protein
LIDKSTYYRDLQEYDISSHDLRFTYARDTYEEKISEGLSEQEAKLHVSEELNHKRREHHRLLSIKNTKINSKASLANAKH